MWGNRMTSVKPVQQPVSPGNSYYSTSYIINHSAREQLTEAVAVSGGGVTLWKEFVEDDYTVPTIQFVDDIDELDTDLSDVEGDLSDVEARVTETEGDVETLDEAAADLRTDVDDLEGTTAAHADDIQSVEAYAEELDEDIGAVEDDVEDILEWRDELGEMFQ